VYYLNYVDLLVTYVTMVKTILRCSHPVYYVCDFLVYGKPATAIETVILTVC